MTIRLLDGRAELGGEELVSCLAMAGLAINAVLDNKVSWVESLCQFGWTSRLKIWLE